MMSIKKLRKKDIDFKQVYSRRPQMSAERKRIVNLLLPAAAIVAVFALIFSLMLARNISLERQIAAENAYLSAPETVSDYARYNELYSKNLTVLILNDDMRLARSAIDSYPSLDSAMFLSISKEAGNSVKVVSYSFDEENGVLIVSGSTTNVFEAASFVSRLEQLDSFLNVGYSGYQLQSGSYLFTAECTLAGSAVTKG